MLQRTILITGCSSGIGRCCALGLRDRGWRVFATARKAEDLATLQKEGVEPHYLDYSEPESIANCAEEVLDKTDGKLDALFNNGAYGQTGAVEDISVDVLRRQFEANFFGIHDLCARVIPAMRARGSGRIVHCSSVFGFVVMKYRGPYCASKYALEALADAMRLELKDAGISVSLIQPGPIQSNFVKNAKAAFLENVDFATSVHREAYEARLEVLDQGGKSTFKLGPEAVLKKLIHAVESPRPKARYYVTLPTHGMALLRRILPNRVLDMMLANSS